MTLALLLELSLRGSLVVAVAALADYFCAGSTRARWRRVWWLVVPLAFLAPMSFRATLPYLEVGANGIYQSPTTQIETPTHREFDLNDPLPLPTGFTSSSLIFWLGLLWLAGVIASALWIILPTWRVQRRWSSERLSTDPALLDLLEDAKASAGVTAPIGLIVSDCIHAPALLGWLRPRILLPPDLTSRPARELRAVLLHELAHFKSLDIPLNWLFSLVRVIHWFNPLAWLATAAWARFIEEAADENAIRWMHESTGTAYGEILLKTLGSCPGGPAPSGALAIGESIENLKRRVLMIRNYHAKSSRGWVALAIVLTLTALLTLSPTFASADEDKDAAKKVATAAMQTWLAEIDAGDYAKSWSDSAQSFQKALTSDAWVAALKQVRAPLGKSLERKQDSADYQVITPKTGAPEGTFVIAQFDSSYENMKYARETVTFEKETDGSWRAAGYFIKPR